VLFTHMDVNHNVRCINQTPIHKCTPAVLLLSLISHQSRGRSIQDILVLVSILPSVLY
jgi:hypothetical protein